MNWHSIANTECRFRKLTKYNNIWTKYNIKNSILSQMIPDSSRMLQISSYEIVALNKFDNINMENDILLLCRIILLCKN